MEDIRDPFEQGALRRLQLFIYLVPVFGMVPAAWTLARRGQARRHREASRLALALGLLWGIGVLAFNTSSPENAMGAGLSMLVLNSVWTSGYFVTLLGLMVQVWRRQPVTIPGWQQINKYMS